MHPQPDLVTKAARQIADEISAAALRDDGDDVYWLTTTFTSGSSEPRSFAAVDLYGGVAGIALFLLEAAHTLGEDRYRDLALAALRWCEREGVQRNNYGLYAGRLGVALVFLRAGQLTGDPRHLKSAMRLTAGNEAAIDSAAGNDLLYGRAGTVLALLHMHAATGETSILQSAQAWLRRLVQEGRWVADGVCWDAAWQNVKGLCGLSHGTAGIALVLMEASRYLSQHSYARLAHEALRYETAAFDPEDGTWVDFRKLGGRPPEQFEREFGHVPDEKLVSPSVMDAWCHGAPGIGLSRVRAYELEGEAHRDEIRTAVERTLRTLDSAEGRSYTLCHGACGNAMLLLEAAPILQRPELITVAVDVARRAAEAKVAGRVLNSGYAQLQGREELSLMMGTAGVGWYLLRVMSDIGDVLLPRLTATAVTGDNLSEGDITRALVRGLFPESAAAVEQNCTGEANAFFSRWRDRASAMEFVRENVIAIGAGDHVSLETEKLLLRDGCRSFALAYVEHWRVARDTPILGRPDAIRGLPLTLSEFVRIWQPEDDVSAPQLLAIIDGDVTSTPLNAFAAAVLSRFEHPATVEEVTASVAAEAGADPDRLRASVEEQVLEACRNGIIAHSRWAP